MSGPTITQRWDGTTSLRFPFARWLVDELKAQIRHHHGVPVRSTDPPIFRFDIDVAAIIDTIALELQDDAERRITDRRTAFVNGRTA